MGRLVNGVWQTDDFVNPDASGGRFQRAETTFRGQLSSEPGAAHAVAADRYHLYVSYACPWAHRTLIARALLGLEEAISVSVVDATMSEEGWSFSNENPDHLGDRRFLRDVYLAAKADYTGRVTVPVLWDKKKKTIVNNESSEILRIFNDAMKPLQGASVPDLYPKSKRQAIDDINETVYHNVNNGVYKAGFAGTQAAYEEAVVPLFDTLDGLEQRLSKQAFLVGEVFTEADIRLFTTLIRFDAVYVTHFKCNLRRIADYPHLWRYTRTIYNMPKVAETVRFDHIKEHYFRSHKSLNPHGIIPMGPSLDLSL